MMAKRAKTTVDTTSIFEGIEKLKEIRESLTRRMGVAGGEVFRDAAKANVPKKSGKLSEAIYLAYRDKESTEAQTVYMVSWNAKKAPHGHLIEFGHWRYNKIINGKAQKSLIGRKRRGRGPQDHGGPGALEVPKWVAAKPFLGPSFDGNLSKARTVMLQVGREQFSVLMKEKK